MATFTNQATLTYNGQTTTSNVTVGELTETLTAAKTAVVPTYGTDGRVTYILSLVNSGTAPLTPSTPGRCIPCPTPPGLCGTIRTAFCRRHPPSPPGRR